MNRWKDTLCGKLINTSQSAGSVQSWASDQQSEVLSCGGKFISRAHESPLKAIKPSLPTIINLPKDQYEIILTDPKDGFLRYGPEPELPLLEADMVDLDLDDLYK